jgi:hypothetical protein
LAYLSGEQVDRMCLMEERPILALLTPVAFGLRTLAENQYSNDSYRRKTPSPFRALECFRLSVGISHCAHPTGLVNWARRSMIDLRRFEPKNVSETLGWVYYKQRGS